MEHANITLVIGATGSEIYEVFVYYFDRISENLTLF